MILYEVYIKERLNKSPKRTVLFWMFLVWITLFSLYGSVHLLKLPTEPNIDNALVHEGVVMRFERLGRGRSQVHMIVKSLKDILKFDVTGDANLQNGIGESVYIKTLPGFSAAVGRPEIPIEVKINGITVRSTEEGLKIYKKFKKSSLNTVKFNFIAFIYFLISPWIYWINYKYKKGK